MSLHWCFGLASEGIRNVSTPSAHACENTPKAPHTTLSRCSYPPLSQHHTRDSAQLVPKAFQEGITASEVGEPEHSPRWDTQCLRYCKTRAQPEQQPFLTARAALPSAAPC